MIGRHAEQVFRHYMDTPPHGEQRPRSHLRTIGCGIAGGVADAKYEDTLAGERLRCAVVVGMNLRASESARAGKGRFRIPRIPVVAVGDQHSTVALGAPRPRVPLPDRDVPAPSRCRVSPGPLGPELNLLAEAVVIDEVIEVLRDHLMA